MGGRWRGCSFLFSVLNVFIRVVFVFFSIDLFLLIHLFVCLCLSVHSFLVFSPLGVGGRRRDCVL